MSHCSRSLHAVLGLALLSWSLAASAWDGVNTGVPGLIEVTAGGNLGTRIHLVGEIPMCGTNSMGWIYLEPTDSNYSTYMAAIFMAKAQGTMVQLYGQKDANGYCRLGHLGMH